MQKAENGETETHVFLIAADYVPNDCDALEEAKDGTHANMTKNSSAGWNVCTSYWNSIPEYHCNDKHNTKLNSSQEQCSFPEVFMTTGNFCDKDHHYYCSDHVGTGVDGNANSRCASSLQCTGNWKSFVDQSTKGGCAHYAIGGPTLEMWVASWNQKYGSDAELDGKTGRTLYANGKIDNEGQTGYYVETSADSKTTSCSLNDTEGYKDTLYFPHKSLSGLDLFDDKKTGVPAKDVNENASCYGYWVSSPSASGANNLVRVYYDGTVGFYGYNGFDSVRPIICLKSNVKLTKTSGKNEKVVYEINM